MKTSLLSIFVGSDARCFLWSILLHQVQVRGDGQLKDKELTQLTQQYQLVQSPFGNFLSSVMYEASATINLTSSQDHLGASYLLVFDGVCKGWIMFPEVDRVYTRVSGKATRSFVIFLGTKRYDKSGQWSMKMIFTNERPVFYELSIDLANSDGEIKSVCLGDSLEDSNCVYMLIIPAGWKADIRPSGYVIYTATTIGGSSANGGSVSFDTMREQYSAYTDLINEVEANCS